MCILENNFHLKHVRSTIVILIFLGSCGNLFGQAKIDSLQNQLTSSIPDSTKVRVMVSLSQEFLYLDFQKSQQFAKDAVKLAEENKWSRGKIIANQNLASLSTLSGDYLTALRYDNIALELAKATGDSTYLTIAYSNNGNDYYDLGEYDEAYYFFSQSYRIAKLLNNKLRMTIALHNVGRVFKELGQYDRALAHLKSSLKMSIQINDYAGVPYSNDELGDIMLRQKKYDSALFLLSSSLKDSRSQGLKELEPRTLTKLATAYLHLNDTKNSLAYYDSTYSLHQKTNNRFGIAEVELGRSRVYIKQKNYDKALQSINTSLTVARELNARVLEFESFRQLSKVWELKGDFNKSLQFYKQYKQVEDSLFSQDMQEKLFRDQMLFETEAKDTQIAALNEAQDRKDDQLKKQEFIQNILVVVMALTGILLVTVYRSGQRRRQINVLLLQHQEDMEKRSEELERLNQVKDKFFSIISHDLRSPINALAGLLDLIDKGAVKAEELPNHVQELKTRFNHTRTLLNNLLDWTLLQMDKLNLQSTKIDLHKIVNENIELLGAVQTKKIQLLNKIKPGSLAFADSNTTNLVIRNLMTNAIKFTNDGGFVTIDSEERATEWMVSVEDNGIGMNSDVMKILFDKTAPYTTRGTANEKGTGLGLILCKEFVEKNGGKIWVESNAGQGSKFSFTIPKAS
jgi:signal transduction histidine kinase